MIQKIKMENWFGLKGGVQDGRHFKAKFNLIAVNNFFSDSFLIVFNSGFIWSCCCCCFLCFEIFKMTPKMTAITVWGITWFNL